MKKVTLLLAMRDELYCERIEEYIQESKLPIEPEIITDRDYFAASSGKERADVVLVSPEFMDAADREFFRQPKVFILSKAFGREEGLQTINPYQKTENLLREVMLKYSELTGEAAFFLEGRGGKSNRKLLSFYSPCGGSGKSTLSLALSGYLASSGKKVLYLCMDAFAGVNALFGEQERGGFSNVLLSLKQSMANQSLLAVSRNMKTEQKTQIMYFSDLENPCDLQEIGEGELEALLKQMVQMNEIDFIIADLGSSLTEQTQKVLELSDFVFLPTLDTPIGRNKAEKLMEAAEVSAFWEKILKKSAWVVNQCSGQPGLAAMQNWHIPMECFTVAKVNSLEGAQSAEQICGMLQRAMYAIAEKALEGCESS